MQAIRLFCDVVQLASFGRAAEKNHITQSAVSQRIRTLEESLGVALLDRSVRPFALTPAGKLLHQRGSALVENYDELLKAVREETGELQGKVRVAAIYSAGIALLNRLRTAFNEQAPAVEVVLEYKRPEEVAEEARLGRADLGIISYPKRWPNVQVHLLRDERMCLACAHHHPLAERARLRAPELADWPLVTFGADLPVGRDIRRYLRMNGVVPRIAHQVDNIDTIVSLLLESGDVAILPERTISREVKLGTLKAIELIPKLHRPIGIIHARRRNLTPAVQAFFEFVVEHAAVNIDELHAEAGGSSPKTVAARAADRGGRRVSRLSKKSRQQNNDWIAAAIDAGVLP